MYHGQVVQTLLFLSATKANTIHSFRKNEVGLSTNCLWPPVLVCLRRVQSPLENDAMQAEVPLRRTNRIYPSNPRTPPDAVGLTSRRLLTVNTGFFPPALVDGTPCHCPSGPLTAVGRSKRPEDSAKIVSVNNACHACRSESLLLVDEFSPRVDFSTRRSGLERMGGKRARVHNLSV